MELCGSCHSPLLVLGGRGGSRPRWWRRGRREMSQYLAVQMPTLNEFTVSQIPIHNCLHKSQTSSLQKGESVNKTCIGFCKVLWIVEADIADGQRLYLAGDLVALGCWDPEMAVLLSPSRGHSNLWKTEIKVPSGIHFKYNYFIKGENQPSDFVWRPGPEFSFSVPFIDMNEAFTVRDLWMRTPKETLSVPLWGSWMEVMDHISPSFVVRKRKASPRGKHKTMLRSENDFSDGESLPMGLLIEDGNSTEENYINLNAADTRHSIFERDQPVEEPWLLRSTLPVVTDSSFISDVSDQTEETEVELLKKAYQSIEKSGSAEEGKVAHAEETVSTVILINSSVCTMQRIAILEDGKLVELLLEPVKNNVQCDSVYLGIVTKLVPHMGGAFVDIGISRPSLMDIKRNREPFAYPPFTPLAKGHVVNGSIKTDQKEHFDAHDHELNLNGEDNTSNEFLDVDHQDNSIQIVHEDFDENEEEDIYVSSSYKRNVGNGNVDYGAGEADLEVDYGENELLTEREAVEESFPIEMGNLNDTELSDFVSQEPKDSLITHSNENKWYHVCKGTKIIVQVVKEGLGTKGPALSAYPNLRSRFWILIARCNRIGVSKKITGVERTRLRVIAKTLQPPGFGLTVRTVAAGHSLEELQKDLEGLLSTWKGIVEHAKSAALAADEGVEAAVPVILHRAMGQTLSVVQDYFNDKVKSMIVDSPRTYHEVTSYLQEIAPDLCDRVVLYNKRTPIFDEYGIEEEIDNILSKRVPLSNGGSLVIEQTEALVSIDVNGGHGMLGQGTSQEKAVLDVNLAAAKQIARELRLRDIGGIIVVDFIDMADDANKRLVYEEVKQAVERDRSMVKVSELSRHGLMEITRKRVRPSVSFLISEPCACCHGTGRVEALETSFSKIEHEISRLLASSNQKEGPENAKSWPRFVLKVDRYMCNYLTSGKRTKLAILSSSLKVWILLKVARGFSRGAFEVKPFTDDRSNDDGRTVPISRLQSAEARSYIPNTKLTLFPIKKWKNHGK